MNRLRVSLVLCLLLVRGAAPIHAQGPPAQQAPPSPIVAAPVIEQSVAATQTFVGTVMPLRVATIGSAVGGRVIERPVEEGDRVEANQKLAQLLTDTISLEVAGAEGELQLRKEQLAELENGTRPEEIAQAEARMAAAAARQEFLDSRYGRMQSLLSSRGAVTEEQVEEAKSQSIEAQQIYLEMKAAYEMAITGPRLETIAQARAQVAIQEALVEKLRDQLQKHTVYARFPGYVTRKLTEVGAWVNPGDPVAEVAQIDEVDILAQVVERSIAYVPIGSEVSIEIPAIPDRMFTGKVITAIPQADVRSRTFPVKIRVKNEIGRDGPLLKSGMLARAALPVGEQVMATLVPKDAIVLGGAQPMVVIVNGAAAPGETGTPVSIPVQLGVAQHDWIQVTGGVKAGQLVIVQGNERIRPGQTVIVSRIVGPPAEQAVPVVSAVPLP
jgi:HlyD family secretion protein